MAQVQDEDTQIIGIVVGTVVVNEYLTLINKLKEVITRAGKKPYEMLVGKLNEPKLKNLAIVDLYCLVSCRETSLVDPREFMAKIVTPHEIFMALIPKKFPWTCKVQTDFRLLLREFEREDDVEGSESEEEEKTAEERAEELED